MNLQGRVRAEPVASDERRHGGERTCRSRSSSGSGWRRLALVVLHHRAAQGYPAAVRRRHRHCLLPQSARRSPGGARPRPRIWVGDHHRRPWRRADGLALVLLVPLLAEQVRQLIAAVPAECERMQAGVEGWRALLARARTFPSLQGRARPRHDRAVAELGSDCRPHHGLDVEPGSGAGELLVAAADHAGRGVLPAGRLASDAGARRRSAAARPRADHPPPGRRDQRRGRGLHSRPGRHLHDARHLLRGRPELGRHRLWPADRADHRPAGLHPDRRLAARPDLRVRPGHRAVLAGPDAARQGGRRAGRRHGRSMRPCCRRASSGRRSACIRSG